MAATFCPLSLTALMDEDGIPLVGARIRFYDAGTSTPRTVYRDGLLGSPYQPNDIRTNAAGRIPPIWIDGNPYRAMITKSAGELIEDIDNLPIDEGSGGGGTPTPDTAIETGDIVWAYRTGARAGWVIPNGLTIGSATSGATGRANADTEDLFLHLWDASATLVVSGGRGANAASDWAANKTIALPDLVARMIGALDSIGVPPTNRLAGVTFSAGNATTLGSYGGVSTVVLTMGQLPATGVSGGTETIGNHSHTGTTAGAGAHTPSGTVTVSYPPHSYTYAPPAGIVGGPGGVFLGNGVGTPAVYATAPPGDQAFNLSGTAVAAHTHTFTTDAGGSHWHPFTTLPLGNGEAHPNMPPFVLMTPYQRL